MEGAVAEGSCRTRPRGSARRRRTALRAGRGSAPVWYVCSPRWPTSRASPVGRRLHLDRASRLNPPSRRRSGCGSRRRSPSWRLFLLWSGSRPSSSRPASTKPTPRPAIRSQALTTSFHCSWPPTAKDQCVDESLSFRFKQLWVAPPNGLYGVESAERLRSGPKKKASSTAPRRSSSSSSRWAPSSP